MERNIYLLLSDAQFVSETQLDSTCFRVCIAALGGTIGSDFNDSEHDPKKYWLKRYHEVLWNSSGFLAGEQLNSYNRFKYGHLKSLLEGLSDVPSFISSKEVSAVGILGMFLPKKHCSGHAIAILPRERFAFDSQDYMVETNSWVLVDSMKERLASYVTAKDLDLYFRDMSKHNEIHLTALYKQL